MTRAPSRTYDAVHWILERALVDGAFTYTHPDVEAALGMPPRTASGALVQFVEAGLLVACDKVRDATPKRGGRPFNVYYVPDPVALQHAIDNHRFRSLGVGKRIPRTSRSRKLATVTSAARTALNTPVDKVRNLTELSLQFAARVEADLGALLEQHERECEALRAQIQQAREHALQTADELELWRELKRRKQASGEPLRHPAKLDRAK